MALCESVAAVNSSEDRFYVCNFVWMITSQSHLNIKDSVPLTFKAHANTPPATKTTTQAFILAFYTDFDFYAFIMWMLGF